MAHQLDVIKHNDHILLDQPLIRLPYELLRNNFRSAHFAVEKESAGIKATLRDAATGCLNGRSAPEDLVRSLDSMIAQAKNLKQKLEVCSEEESRLMRQEDARLRHIDDLYKLPAYTDIQYEAWSSKRLDRLMVDYMLRQGYVASATELSDKQGLSDLVDVETLTAMNRIRTSLQNQNVSEALAWCAQNKKELRKLDGRLEFELRFQQYIELIRYNSDARTYIAYAKKYLVPQKNTFPTEVGAACGMLAFSDPSRSGYNKYFSQDRWNMLANLFVEAHNTLLGLPPIPLIHIALSSGLPALKTPACKPCDHENFVASENRLMPSALGAGQQSVCPICSMELDALSRDVPYAHHIKSHVTNDLVLLPSMHVYSRAQLLDNAKKAGLPSNLVRDLRTGQTHDISTLKKVFMT